LLAAKDLVAAKGPDKEVVLAGRGKGKGVVVMEVVVFCCWWAA